MTLSSRLAGGERRLSELRTGERARVVGVEPGQGLRARLLALGITRGVVVQVVQRHSGGPYIVMVRGSRVALGGDLLSHIRVAPLP